MHRHATWWHDPDHFGEPFARMEALVMLGAILRRFRLQPDEGREVRLRAGIVLEPRDGVHVRLEPL